MDLCGVGGGLQSVWPPPPRLGTGLDWSLLKLRDKVMYLYFLLLKLNTLSGEEVCQQKGLYWLRRPTVRANMGHGVPVTCRLTTFWCMSLCSQQLGHHGSAVACTTHKQEIWQVPSLAGLNLLWRCDPGQGLYLHVHSLDPGVSGYLIGQWRLLCVWIVSSAVMAAGLYAPQGVEMAYEWTGPATRG